MESSPEQMAMVDRIGLALDICAERLEWSNAKIAAESGVGEMSIRNYRNRKGQPSASTYQRMRERIPGFAELVDGKAAA